MEQSLIHLLRKEHENFLARISCSSCQEKLDLENCYVKGGDLNGDLQEPLYVICEKCKGYYSHDKDLTTFSELAQIYEFFKVKCPKHPEQFAKNYFESTFQPLCIKCHYPLNVCIRKINYKEIEKEFFTLYKKYENSLCSDRKKSLITFNTSQLLKACSWLKQIEFGPLCTKHPWNFSIGLSPSLETSCNICEDPAINSIALTDTKKISDIILDAIKIKSKDLDAHYFNNYMIKTLWISTRINKKDWEINLMALEALDMIQGRQYEKVRCVKCLKGISLGIRTGVSLDCGHVFCFTCAFIQDNNNCPIDYKQISYSTYLNIDEAKVPQCHALHDFDGQKIFKLPCFHYSCEADLRLGNCLVCGFEFEQWGKTFKESKKTKSLDDFMMIRCFEHNAKVSCFQLLTLGFYCKNCMNADNTVSVGNNLEFVYGLFNSLLPGFFEKHANSGLAINNLRFLKLACYLKVLSNQNKHLFLGIIQTYLGYSRLYSTHQILFYSELIPKLTCSYKSLVLTKVQDAVLKVIPNEDFILCSVFIANQYLLLPCYSYPAVVNCVTITSHSKKGQELDKKSLKLLAYCEQKGDNQYKEFILSSSVYLSDSCWYEIAVELNPGEYFHGKLLSRTKNKEFLIQNISKDGSEIGRYGGPFIGIGIFSFGSL